jgi:hypothetical protein
MKHIIIPLILLLAVSDLFSQSSLDNVLKEIEKNNTTLAAFRKDIDADKIGNKTGLLPSNPEAELNYLWGSPVIIGDRIDFSIRQTIDFPTAYLYRNRISDLKNNQAEFRYQDQLRNVMIESRLICADLVYVNALGSELARRQENAERIARSFRVKFETGDVGILEFNKAQVNLLTIRKKAEENEIERKALSAELTQLNGGNPVSFDDSTFIVPDQDPDFESWFKSKAENNPSLQWIKEEVIVSQENQKLNSALGLPKITGGYMSEKVVGEQYQGITMGVSVPLWENKNKVKYAKAKADAAQSIEADAQLRFYNNMKALHSKVMDLKKSIAEYHSELEKYSNAALLLKALDKGEISLGEYIFELSMYYESTDKLLDMERNLNKAYFELNKFE